MVLLLVSPGDSRCGSSNRFVAHLLAEESPCFACWELGCHGRSIPQMSLPIPRFMHDVPQIRSDSAWRWGGGEGVGSAPCWGMRRAEVSHHHVSTGGADSGPGARGGPTPSARPRGAPSLSCSLQSRER